MRTLDHIFSARSVAVIGASSNLKSPGARVLRYLLRSFTGSVFPVNPRHEQIQGARAYASVREIPGEVDLAILVVPALSAKRAVMDCAEKGVGGVLIFSAGFRETGEAGSQLEQELADIAAEHDMRIVGPNCAGFATMESGLYATFSATVENEVRDGSVAVISQSGGFGAVVFSLLQAQGIGVSHFITTGNELDVSVADAILNIVTNPNVKVILAFSEGVKNPERFVAALRAVQGRNKTIVVSHGGRSAAGARAVQSHTAATVTPKRVWAGILAQYGAIQCHDVEQMVDVATMSVGGEVAGGRCAIVTQTGGNGVLMVDELSAVGMTVPRLRVDDKLQIGKLIPPYGSAENPIDVTGQMSYDIDLCRNAVLAAAELDYIDVVVCVLGPNDDIAESLAEMLLEVNEAIDKPLVVTWMGGRLLSRLTAAGVPAFPTPSRAALALSRSLRHLGDRIRESTREIGHGDCIGSKGPSLGPRGSAGTPTPILEADAKALLSDLGFQVPEACEAGTVDEVVAAGESIGFPLVMKILDKNVLHRQEYGGVVLGIQDLEGLRTAFSALQTKFGNGTPVRVLVERMVPPGVELLLGMTRDNSFGVVISVGMGGSLVEIVDEVHCRVAPFDLQQARDAIAALYNGRLVGHIRGIDQKQTSELAKMMVALAEFAEREPNILEIDCNPIIVNGSGVTLVDALMMTCAEME